MRHVNEKELSSLKGDGWVKIAEFDRSDPRERQDYQDALDRYENKDELSDREFALVERGSKVAFYASEPDIDDFTDMSWKRDPHEKDDDYRERIQDLEDFMDNLC